ncbi:nucleotidyltransferase [Achromobacter ruhlandii]|uniref:SMODS domain-containing nucleotidyltransferase n=1 Tax=Achromobacter ruhlandii TaxID=72557 RepID=UPI0021F17C3C|nr:nucleotidyltransferase [Achromobacter ruhlandii]MCV6795659.1 nucleotidyltransferase [Achromobacter ruhlandii]MCV6800607.1 nucleotidyltransferase [Achromobacter ruhlandii]MCV6807299.1 nucleotidyltransferase [Achromobacter ruhlandii]MCV6817594.1 nucleotidyltransferase [Achromobacter ruhlandii]
MSVISYLDARASSAVLSTDEQASINASIVTIKSRLNSYFGTALSEQLRFGSSTRGTILPRKMDQHSDIDYMVVFAQGGAVPQTYLDRLKRFAEQYYSTSDIKQSSPSLVLQLNHIKFDLVPALKVWGTTYQIPDGPATWQNTNPNDFNGQLDALNHKEMYKIKPMIRLLKYWNAEAGYIFDAYSLEKFVVSLSYYGVINIRDYLFTAFDNLYLGSDQAQWRKDKVKRAKDIIAEVRSLERDGYPNLAEAEVKKLIPSA